MTACHSTRAVQCCLVSLLLTTFSAGAAYSAEPAPKSLDPRIEIRLFAETPQIVTPTDVDVDHLGRVWAIESNTHFRPAGYKGHSSDRVLIFSDDDHDGKADRVEMFADGFVHAMSIAVRFGDAVYVATRKEVFRLVDSNGDGKADRRDVILKLDTPGDYPHNGTGGLCIRRPRLFVHRAGRKPRRRLSPDRDRWQDPRGRRRRRKHLSLPSGRQRSHALGDGILESPRLVRRCLRADVYSRQRPR